MKVREESCHGCNGNDFKSHYAPLSYTCQHCGHEDSIQFPVGKDDLRILPTPFLNPFRLFDVWNQIIENAHNFSLINCAKCDNVVHIPRDTVISLPCEFCSHANEYPISNEVMDALPDGWLSEEKKVMNYGYSMKMESDFQVTKVDEDTICPSCNSTIPPFEGHTSCTFCDHELFAISACGKRVIPGFKVRGRIKEQGDTRSITGWYNLQEFQNLYVEAKNSVGNGNPIADSFSGKNLKRLLIIFFGLQVVGGILLGLMLWLNS